MREIEIVGLMKTIRPHVIGVYNHSYTMCFSVGSERE